jgi:hypothetical protein
VAGIHGSFLSVSSSAVVTPPAFSSLYTNGNFASSTLTGWTLSPGSLVKTTQYVSAPQSLCVALDPNPDPSEAFATLTLTNLLTVGTTYSLSLWVKSINGSNFYGTANLGTNSIPLAVSSQTAWQKLTVSGVCLNTSTFTLNFYNNTTDFYLDDIALNAS